MTAPRAAVFLDRDGTIILDRHYPGDPAAVELIEGAAEAIVRLRNAGYLILVITNQSGIGRGLISDADYQAVEGRMESLLAKKGAMIDGAYYCPHSPDQDPPCDCRKPNTGLYLRAASDHDVDPSISFFIGDRLRDVLPGAGFGGRGFFVRGTEAVQEDDLPPGIRAVDSLAEATELLLGSRV